MRSLALLLLPLALAAGQADPLPFPDMAAAIGQELAQHYYDPSRFRPRLMVERALRALEQAELAIDTLWADDRIVLNLRGERTTIPAPAPADRSQALRLLDAVRNALDAHFEATAQRRRELAYALINGALSTLDPHTVLWPPEEARQWMDENIHGQFFGIGAFLQQEEGQVMIQRVMPGLPAERAGVEDGDIILAIDGEPTAGLTLDQAVRRIKGPRGTPVRLTLQRKRAEGPIELSIVRDLVRIITMRHYRDEGVGYVRMDEFNANAANDLFNALRELEREGPLKALVLDLRFNGGGLLDQAKLVGQFFLARGQEVVRTTTIDGRQEVFVCKGRRVVTAPLAVLVSASTASAAEIVSGALQLNERAVILGETTFGKGSVQHIRELRDGSRLKLTIQEYLLPGGLSIQDVGVSPDIRLPRHAQRQDGRLDLRDPAPERERDHEFALTARRTYQRQPVAELIWLDPWLDREARRVHAISARDFRPDRQAQLVIDLLKEASRAADWDAAAQAALADERLRPFLLERLLPAVRRRAEAEAAAIADALARLPQPVRWGEGGEPPAGALGIAWTGPEAVTAGESVALTVEVRNRGPAEVGRLYAVVRADPRSPFWEDEFVIGAVPAGAAAVGVLHTQVPPRLPAGSERFTVELYQDGRPDLLASCPVELRIISRPAPRLDLAWQVADDDGDGRLAPDERADLVITVENNGDAPLDAGAVWIEKDNDPFVSLGASRLTIAEPVAPGTAATLRFPLRVRSSALIGGKEQPLQAERIALQVSAVETFPDEVDGRFRAMIRAKLEIPLRQPLRPRRLQAPRIELAESARDGERWRLAWTISDRHDDPAQPPLELVALFHDEDKVDLRMAAALEGPSEGPWTYRAKLALKPELNTVRLVVRDADGVVVESLHRLWGPPRPAEAPSARLPPP